MAADEEWIATNRALWDERVPIHLASDYYDVDSFLAGACSLRPFELAEMGDVAGKTLVHPQCHFGMDTLCWARRGARVTGLDFSVPAIAAARQLASDAGLESEFVHANVYEAARALDGRRFDIVYTGTGAINWLPEVERWAQTMAGLLKPGGLFYFAEFHPFTGVFGDDDLAVTQSYFERGPFAYDEPGTYADPAAPTRHNRSVEWHHRIGDVVSALASAGLRIELLHEHDYTLHARWPFLSPDERHHYRMPDGMPALPLMYSLRATLTR